MKGVEILWLGIFFSSILCLNLLVHEAKDRQFSLLKYFHGEFQLLLGLQMHAHIL